MTRHRQKIAERRALGAVLAALDLRPDQEPQDGEAPDFTLPVSGKVIGVEITIYQSGAIVEDGTARRPVESEWERLKIAADALRNQRPDLLEINIGLMFHNKVPPRRDHPAFLEEIAAFVEARLTEFTSQDRQYWPTQIWLPLMRAYLRAIHIRKDKYAEWYTNLSAGYVDRPGHNIAKIVANKSTKAFRPVDELWLAIQCGTHISEMMLDIVGVEDFAAVPDLDGGAFARVFVLAYTGAYEWRRGAGWRQIMGDSTVNPER